MKAVYSLLDEWPSLIALDHSLRELSNLACISVFTSSSRSLLSASSSWSATLSLHSDDLGGGTPAAGLKNSAHCRNSKAYGSKSHLNPFRRGSCRPHPSGCCILRRLPPLT